MERSDGLNQVKVEKTGMNGKPAGVLIGFASKDDWFDYRLEHDPKFLRRVAEARNSLREGEGIRLEDLPD